MKYPPCRLGLFSEKPSRHNFEIKLDKDDKPYVFERDGLFYYHSVCTKCGLNDPNPVRF